MATWSPSCRLGAKYSNGWGSDVAPTSSAPAARVAASAQQLGGCAARRESPAGRGTASVPVSRGAGRQGPPNAAAPHRSRPRIRPGGQSSPTEHRAERPGRRTPSNHPCLPFWAVCAYHAVNDAVSADTGQWHPPVGHPWAATTTTVATGRPSRMGDHRHHDGSCDWPSC